MASDPPNAGVWNGFADAGRLLLVGGAIVAPLLRRDYRSSFNAVTAILTTFAVSKATKAFWDEPRPNDENDKSFPSLHAADCFAAAVSIHREWRDAMGSAAIGLATAVSLARVFSGKHHVVDVAAGGSLGIIAAHASARLRL